jgi:NNP family nitrate/nitrite transporter-like MFS transporter
MGFATFGALAACACLAILALRGQWLVWANPAGASGDTLPAAAPAHSATPVRVGQAAATGK